MRRASLLLLLAGCGRSGEVDFPARLAPLEDNTAPRPAPVDGDPYPEVLVVVSGGDADLWWAHARGFVQAPSGLVWEAARVPEVSVDRREVDEWTVTHDTVPEFDHSYTIHNVVRDVLTVEYDSTWVHELQKGTDEAPERVVAQWDKTDGTPFIDLLAGSMVLTPVAPGVTEVELVQHLRASLRDDETIASYLRDLYADLVATVHGDPLSTFD